MISCQEYLVQLANGISVLILSRKFRDIFSEEEENVDLLCRRIIFFRKVLPVIKRFIRVCDPTPEDFQNVCGSLDRGVLGKVIRWGPYGRWWLWVNRAKKYKTLTVEKYEYSKCRPSLFCFVCLDKWNIWKGIWSIPWASFLVSDITVPNLINSLH